jgi:hypothetical protein
MFHFGDQAWGLHIYYFLKYFLALGVFYISGGCGSSFRTDGAKHTSGDQCTHPLFYRCWFCSEPMPPFEGQGWGLKIKSRKHQGPKCTGQLLHPPTFLNFTRDLFFPPCVLCAVCCVVFWVLCVCCVLCVVWCCVWCACVLFCAVVEVCLCVVCCVVCCVLFH